MSIKLTSVGNSAMWLPIRRLFSDISGAVTGLVGVIVDFTDQKKTEEELGATQEKIRRQNQYMIALHDISLGLLNRLDVNDLLKEIVLKAS